MQDKKEKRLGIYLYGMEIQKTQERWQLTVSHVPVGLQVCHSQNQKLTRCQTNTG